MYKIFILNITTVVNLDEKKNFWNARLFSKCLLINDAFLTINGYEACSWSHKIF